MAGDSDEEKEKRPRKGPKKQRVENASAAVSGDEGAGTSEPKKKRKGKLRKEGPVASGGEVTEEEALFSGEEMEDRPKKVGHPYYHRLSRRILIFVSSARKRNVSFGTRMTRKVLRLLSLERSNCKSHASIIPFLAQMFLLSL